MEAKQFTEGQTRCHGGNGRFTTWWEVLPIPSHPEMNP